MKTREVKAAVKGAHGRRKWILISTVVLAIRNHVTAELPAQATPVKTLEESEIEMIRRALTETDGNRTHAADLLGITRRGLFKKIKRFGLDV